MLNTLKNIFTFIDYKRSASTLNHSLRFGEVAKNQSLVLMLYRLEPRSGGLRNTARIANALSTHLKKSLCIYIQNTSNHDTDLIREYGFNGEIYHSLPKEADIYLTTSWIFSLSLPEELPRLGGKWVHIIQDYDELFFPVSTKYYHASKVKFGPDSFIASGKWMKLPGKTAYLPFPIDSEIYHNDPQSAAPRDIDVLFFHKPELPRRCALLCEQLAKTLLAERPNLRISFYGSSLSKWLSKINVQHLGALSTLEGLGDIYRRAHIGISFNLTNPSLIPFEHMACGCFPISPFSNIPTEFYLPGIHVEGTLTQLSKHILTELDSGNLEQKTLENYHRYLHGNYLCLKKDFDAEIIKAIQIL